MAKAFETLAAQVEASSWVFVRSTLDQWCTANPNGTLDDFVEEVRKRTNQATDRLIEVEVENGSTRADAERMVRQMH